MGPAVELYLDLMKRCLTRLIFIDQEHNRVRLNAAGWKGVPRRALAAALRRARVDLVHATPANVDKRLVGRDWPQNAETMVGLARLDNIQQCVEDVLANDVPGDLIETGVWRGGSSIFMRAILAAHGDPTRVVWLADSFRGLPPPNAEKYPADAGKDLYKHAALAVSVDEVRRNFERYGLLDERVRFLVGWFSDTLPTAPIDRLAVVRLDGDLYESTMDAISALYPKLSVGGYLIVDDYGAIEACRLAVHDYRDAHGITDEIISVDGIGVYWKRSS